MTALYTLETDTFLLQVSQNGAAIHRLLYKPKKFEVLRVGDSKLAENSGLFPMIPFANRIKGNKFTLEGKEFQLPLHNLDETYLLHGDAWQKEWRLDKTSTDTSTLALTLKSEIRNQGLLLISGHYEIRTSAQSLVRLDDTYQLIRTRIPFWWRISPFLHDNKRYDC